MSFKQHTLDKNSVMPIEEHPCGAFQPEVGMALVMTDGKLAKATGSTKPTYISVTHRSAAVADGEMIQVIRNSGDIVFETQFAADAAAVKVGNKVTIHTDAMTVTATTANGVAEVVAMNGTAEGSTCLVRFS